jgi:hypothetical protein
VQQAQHSAALPLGELQALMRAPASASTSTAASASMAPRMSRLPDTTATASDTPPVKTLSVQDAKRKMDQLIDAFDDCGLKAQEAASPDAQIPLLDSTMDVASEAFELYASLPRNVAVHVISDRDLRRLRDGAMHVDFQLTSLVSSHHRPVTDKRDAAVELLDKKTAANAQLDQPLDLKWLVDTVKTRQQAVIGLWDETVMRSQRVLDIATIAARIADAPDLGDRMKVPFFAVSPVVVLFSSFAALEQRVALAFREIDDAGQCRAPPRPSLTAS